MTRPPSPYLVPGFYDTALAQGRHRDIVGGRWDETGRVQMAALQAEGLQPHHRLLDIGAGSLRLGCKAVPFLNPGHYWATDASRALMLR
ncbi:MAG TPA: class I SAM-dependent methyltransferase, partial [Paracoccaceae bacterium]|nr:class I SAM-dependent methyltransferase [Paracoccaceae bacterium]